MTMKSDIEALKSDVAALRTQFDTSHALAIHKANIDAATAEPWDLALARAAIARTRINATSAVVETLSTLWAKVPSVRVSVEWPS